MQAHQAETLLFDVDQLAAWLYYSGRCRSTAEAKELISEWAASGDAGCALIQFLEGEGIPNGPLEGNA